MWLGYEIPQPVFKPFIWNVDTVGGNVKWILLLGDCNLLTSRL